MIYYRALFRGAVTLRVWYNSIVTGLEVLPMVSESLIKSTQLSFVEDAPGTHAVLEKTGALLRYAERGGGESRLVEEWRAILDYLELRRLLSPDRFSYEIDGSMAIPAIFLSRGRLLTGVMEHVAAAMLRGPTSARISIHRGTSDLIELTLEAGSRKERHEWPIGT